MNSSVTLVIFEGGLVETEIEEAVRQVRLGIVKDLVIKAKQAGFERIILLTSYQDLAKALGDIVEIEYQPQRTEGFHFGEKLLETVIDKQLAKVLYMGGASAPLISSHELSYLRKLLENHENVVTANNYYSADIIGFSPGSILKDINLPMVDNSLAMELTYQTDLKFIPVQRSLGLQFDLDTPADMLVLAAHPHIGNNTKTAVTELNLDLSNLNSLKQVINSPQAELLIYGRVGSLMFKFLDEFTRCRIRLFSEERGLKSQGRDVRGEVNSLVAKMISVMGYRDFFQFLPEICDGAVLDTRIIFSHFKWDLSQSDRFYSDVGMADKIEHPELREFTIAAHNSPIPVMMGGHSLVTGGLWALSEASYLEAQATEGKLEQGSK